MNNRQSAACELSNEQIQVLITGKFDRAFIVSEIIRKFAPQCFHYKLISSETIQRWSKLQEELKSADIDIESINKRHLSNMLEKVSI